MKTLEKSNLYKFGSFVGIVLFILTIIIFLICKYTIVEFDSNQVESSIIIYFFLQFILFPIYAIALILYIIEFKSNIIFSIKGDKIYKSISYCLFSKISPILILVFCKEYFDMCFGLFLTLIIFFLLSFRLKKVKNEEEMNDLIHINNYKLTKKEWILTILSIPYTIITVPMVALSGMGYHSASLIEQSYIGVLLTVTCCYSCFIPAILYFCFKDKINGFLTFFFVILPWFLMILIIPMAMSAFRIFHH